MNIAYITDQLLPRTATDTKQMVSMASALGSVGAAVTMVTPRKWWGRVPTVDDIAAYFEVEPSFALTSVRSIYPNIRGFEKLAQGLVGPLSAAANQADVLYTRTLPVLIGALLVGSRPVVYETYRPWPDQNRQSHGFFRWVGRHPRFLGAILHSNLARDSYARIGMPEDKLLTAYNGYQADLLEPRIDSDQARQACGLPGKGKIVTYTGRISRKKGLDLVLDMAAALPDTTFVLVGSEGNGRIEQRAAQMANVIVESWKPMSEITPYLFASDVLIIPPTSRPLHAVGNTVLPIKTFLYMAAGRAILAPGTPDLRELLIDDENAVLVAPDEPQIATRRLRDLLGDDAMRNRLADAARSRVEGFTWESRAAAVIDFISARLAVLQPGAGPSY